MTGRIIPTVLEREDAAETLERAWAAGDVVLPLAPEASDRPLPTDVSAAIRDGRALPEDAALIVLTSGSTGAPRGVVLTHGALGAAVAASNARLGCRPGDRWTLALPLHHIAGLMVVLRARALGSAAATELPGPGGAHVALVPIQLARLLRTGADLAHFGTIVVGGGPASPGIVEAARAAGGRIVTSYGMTETAGGCVYDGLPLEGTEVGLDADGRIRLQGPMLASGYLDGRDERDGGGFRSDGWFVTSDRGRLEDGRLVVEGRVDDVIITGGENVAVGTVLEVLLRHPDVADAAVVGIEDSDWGQRVRAVIVPRDPAAPPCLEGLRAHVRAVLPVSHAPTELLVLPRVPRDALGKLRAEDRSTLARSEPTEVQRRPRPAAQSPA